MRHVGPIAGVATWGNLVATAGYDNRVILWDGARRRALARATHDHLVNACAFSSDGLWLVTASSDHTARIWSIPDLRLQAVLSGHEDDVDMARFSPDGRLIATCALDRKVRVFNRAGKCLWVLAGHTGNVLSLVWRDDWTLVTSSVDGTLREWNALEGRLVRTIALGMRSDCVAVLASGRIIAGDDDGRIAVVDDAKSPVFTSAHSAGIKALLPSCDGEELITLGYDRTLAIWRIGASGTAFEQARSGLPATIWARSATRLDDGRIVVATFGGTYAIYDSVNDAWDMEGVEPGEAINALIEHEGVAYSVGDAGIVRGDGQVIAELGSLCNFIVAHDRGLYAGGHLGRLLCARTGSVLYQHPSPLNCAVIFERDNETLLAVGTYTGEIVIFSLSNPKQPERLNTLRPFSHAVKGLSFADGLLFSVCASTDATWHRVADWTTDRTQVHAHERIANACCALGANQFASVGRDRVLKLWSSEAELAQPTAHPNSVKCMAASPDGQLILTGSYGGTVAMFNRLSGEWCPIQRIAKAGISAVAWSARENGFLAATYAGEVLKVAA